MGAWNINSSVIMYPTQTPTGFQNIYNQTLTHYPSGIFFQADKKKSADILQQLGVLSSLFDYRENNGRGDADYFGVLDANFLDNPAVQEKIRNGKIVIHNERPPFSVQRQDGELTFHNADAQEYFKPEHARPGDAILGGSVPAGFERFQLSPDELSRAPGIGRNDFDSGSQSDANFVAYNIAKVPTDYEFITFTPKDGGPPQTIRNPYYGGASVYVRQNGDVVNIGVGNDNEYLPMLRQQYEQPPIYQPPDCPPPPPILCPPWQHPPGYDPGYNPYPPTQPGGSLNDLFNNFMTSVFNWFRQNWF